MICNLNQANEHIPPWLATVTYLGDVGAPTVVLPVAADREGRAVPTGADDGGDATRGDDVARGDVYISYPVAGKHICFDGRLLHGALHDLLNEGVATPPDAALAPVEPIEPYVRVSLLVNVWVGHRTADARRLPSELASRFSDLGEVASFAHATSYAPRCADPAAESAAGPRADDGSAGDGCDGWRYLRVGFVPAREHTDAFPGWRRYPGGLPFFHPPIRVRGIPSAARAAAQCGGHAPPSLQRVAAELACQCWEEDAQTSDSERD